MNYTINNKTVDEMSQQIMSFLKDSGVDKREVSRFRLLYEEILLKYRERFGEGCACTLNTDKRLGQSRVIFKLEGAPFDPFATEADANGMVNRLAAGLGILPVWSYKDGINSVILVLKRKRKRSSARNMLVAVVSAVIMGLLVGFLPEKVQNILCTWLAAPIADLFIRLITAISGPLVFFSVLCGIYGIGDVATFGKIGKTVIGRFLLMACASGAFTVAVCAPFFSIGSGAAEGADFSQLLDMILNIVPNNLFTPFTDNNPMQIIFVAVILGVAMIFLGNRSADTAHIAEQLNDVIQLIMMYVSKLVPVFVFICIFNIIVKDQIPEVVGLYKPILLVVLCDLAFIVIEAIITSLRRKVGTGLLIKKALPVFIGGLTTASSAAVFGLNVETCKSKLGIDKSLVDFGIPLGQVLYKPAGAIMLIVYGLSLCEIYDVAMAPEKLLVLFIISVVLSIAAPPIPGGALTIFSIIIAQMGVPTEAIALCVTMDVVVDFVTTGTSLFALDMELTECAGRLNMLSTDVLRSK